MADTPSQKPVVLQAFNVGQAFAQRQEVAQVLYDISLTVHENDFVIIHGQSGSGKTTFLNVISGLEAPSQGKVVIKDQDLYSLSSDHRAYFRATHLGIVYQQAHWIRALNVLQNVAFPLITFGTRRPVAEKQAMQTLEKLELAHLAQQDPSELSGGEQQRVGIARAIVHDPWLIIADEPTGNLDTHNSDMVMSLFSLLSVREGRTIILVTHNPIYEFYGTQTIEIRDGHILRQQSNEH